MGSSLPTLSSFNRAHLENLIVDQLVRKSTFHRTLMFIILKSHCWRKRNQSMLTSTFLSSIFMSSSHLGLGPFSGLFPWCFLNEVWYEFFWFYTGSVYLSCLALIHSSKWTVQSWSTSMCIYLQHTASFSLFHIHSWYARKRSHRIPQSV
jgi:hypothetical protein